MTREPFEKRRRMRIVLAVLAVGIVMSLVVAVALIYMGRLHSGV